MNAAMGILGATAEAEAEDRSVAATVASATRMVFEKTLCASEKVRTSEGSR